MRSRPRDGALVTMLALLVSIGPASDQAHARPKKKLSLAEVAALEWKLEQATTTLAQNPKAKARAGAVAELGSFPDARVVMPLAIALKEDPAAAVRLKAARALGAFKTPEAKGALTLAAKADPDAKVRQAAQATLATMPRKLGVAKVAIPSRRVPKPKGKVTGNALKKMMQQPGGDARLWAIKQIAKTKFKGREALLKKHLRRDPSSRVRVGCAEILGSSKNGRRMIKDLLRAISDGDPAVRFAIARALAEFNDPGAMVALQRLAASDSDATVRAEAKDLLEPQTPVGRRLLGQRIKKLSSASAPSRIQALKDLSAFTHWRAMVPMSCALLTDSSAAVRATAAKHLANMHDVSVLTALRVAAVVEPNAKQRKVVRGVVKALRNRVDKLTKQLKSTNAGQRALAARALGQAAYAPGFKPLMRAVKDKDPRVRLAAVRGLRNFDNPKAVDALRVAGSDRDKAIRRVVDRFFKRQTRLNGWRGFFRDTNRMVTKTMDKNPTWRADATIALGVAGADSAVGTLVQLLLNDKDERVRLAAAWSLVLMASDAGEKALRKAAAKDKSQAVRLAARKYLVIEKVSVDDLLGQLRDSSAAVRRDAAEALSLRASGPVLHHLVRAAMCDADADVRAASLRGLARMGKPLGRSVIRIARDRDEDRHVKRVAMIMDFLSGGKK